MRRSDPATEFFWQFGPLAGASDGSEAAKPAHFCADFGRYARPARILVHVCTRSGRLAAASPPPSQPRIAIRLPDVYRRRPTANSETASRPNAATAAAASQMNDASNRLSSPIGA